MKSRPMINAACCLVLAPISGSSLYAQGSLDPPAGPPAPTMKSLEQVEPRTLISALPFSIGEPGSYYLTADLTGVTESDGIVVDADDVTLDLNGFTLRGVGGAHGIFVTGARKNLTVRNGVIRDWVKTGIDASAAVNTRFADLLVTDNALEGLKAGDKSTVRNCQATENTQVGIQVGDGCRLEGCQVSNNTAGGIVTGAETQMIACQASANGVHGIVVASDSQVTNCHATANSELGIGATGDRCTIVDCVATSNSTDGIQVANDSSILNSSCHRNGLNLFGSGIRVTGDRNRIEGNHLTFADRGLWVTGTENHIAGNTVQSNAVNYDFAAGNHLNLLLSEIPETIEWPATIELAGTLTGISGSHGITVDSSNVTIDLKGHTLIGVAGSLDGITVINRNPRHRNLTVQNGVLRDWGGSGLQGQYCKTGRVERVAATANGGNGLWVGSGGSFDAAHWLVSNCHANNNTLNGVFTGENCIVENCGARHNTLSGIRLSEASVVRNCTASYNLTEGIRTDNDNRIEGNTCDANGTDGIRLSSGDNRVDSNHVTDNDGRGIACTASGNLVIRNTAADNDTANYFFSANNRHGPIVDVDGVDGDISGTAGSNHPWANFEF